MTFIEIKLLNGDTIKRTRQDFNFANKESPLSEDDISVKMGTLTKYIPKKAIAWISIEK